MQDRFRFRAWIKQGLWEGTLKNVMVSPDMIIINPFPGIRYCGDNYLEEDAVLMQCTGLKDREGNLIYEGDILEVTSPEGKTTLHEVIDCTPDGYPAFDLFPSLDCESNSFSYAYNECEIEILGNIHEHPNLWR